jgi:peptide/nickel transport system permease protein
VSWWARPLVRMIAAIALPFIAPALVTWVLWLLPGDPVSILCPIGTCSVEGRVEMASAWHLDKGPAEFFSAWLGGAISGDFGNSWRVATGIPVWDLITESVPNTAKVVGVAMIPLLLSSGLVAVDKLSERLDVLWRAVGIMPAVIFALVCTAYVQVTYGALSLTGFPNILRIVLAGLVLGTADGALSGAVQGARQTFGEERKARYVQISLLRGESFLKNTLPNVLPALTGQFRARVLHLLSGAVIVEVVMQVEGLGDLLWQGTLRQDFAVVLAAAFGFSLLSGGLMLLQALVEIGVAMQVRRSPVGSAAC